MMRKVKSTNSNLRRHGAVLYPSRLLHESYSFDRRGAPCNLHDLSLTLQSQSGRRDGQLDVTERRSCDERTWSSLYCNTVLEAHLPRRSIRQSDVRCRIKIEEVTVTHAAEQTSDALERRTNWIRICCNPDENVERHSLFHISV